MLIQGHTVLQVLKERARYLFEDGVVYKGPMNAFRDMLDLPDTWLLMDGVDQPMPPVVYGCKQLLVNSPDQRVSQSR
jgi:hypothetical protein